MATRTKPHRSKPRQSLVEYRRKRDFAQTKEPAGGSEGADQGTLAFVIQKHDASHLHFDLRLEVDGVMKSWAVPKGPSRDPSVKRLAMHVEDHPIEYNEFEGTIPKGQYGGGTVMIWDRGTYTSPDGDEAAIRAALEKGTLKFTLHGERLEGTWTLVRMKRGKEWLLIKHSDANDVTGDDLPAQDVGSVVTGRRMSEIAEGAEVAATKKSRAGKAKSAEEAATSDAIGDQQLLPMLASVGREVPTGDGWAFEPKYDGVRVLAFADGDAVALITRNGRDKVVQFPEVAAALTALSKRVRRPFILDGEIVPRRGEGLGRFQELQQRIGETGTSTIARHAKDAPVVLVAFDLLFDGSIAYADKPWETRRKALERLVSGRLPAGLMLGEVSLGDGDAMLERARDEGWEGVMAKRIDATYTPGVRTKHWRKLKVEGRQELVVGGWSEPRGSRQHIGALLVGYWKGDEFVYAGRVGGGLTQTGLADLYKTLHALERKTSPFAEKTPRSPEPVHWVKPEVVVEVKFNEWTSDGRLRQPVFLGVRDDKDASEIVREPSPMKEDGATKSSSKKPAVNARTTHRRATGRADGVSEELDAIEDDGGKGTVELPGGIDLPVTNLGKIYFPRADKTKGDLMRYYDQVAPVLLPHIADRPLVLKRYPNGVAAKPFFQQNAPDDAPAVLRIESVPSESTEGRRIIGGDLFTLLYGVQLGAIDVNPWHSRIGSLDTPDYTIIDLDPGPSATFTTIVHVAKWVKEQLDAAGLSAGLKTSGSRGLHVVIPLPPGTNEDAALLVSQIVAQQVADEHPKEATVIRSRAARPAAAVYVDYLQNIVGKSVASVFSVRPRPEATVSTPLDWDELTPRLKPQRFTMDVVVKESAERGELWAKAMAAKNSLDALT